MRNAATLDYWRRVYQRKYAYTIDSIDFMDIPSLGDGDVKLFGGITAICGSNGTGKTTLINAIRCISQNIENETDRIRYSKLKGSSIMGHIIKNGNPYERIVEISSELVMTSSCEVEPDTEFIYIDSTDFPSNVSFFAHMTNINEIIEQYEEIVLSERDLEILSYLVGKEYSSCRIYELTDFNDHKIIPYFIVESSGICYSTETMGLGEYSAIYIFWYMSKIANNAILLVEEPETFLSPRSQEAIMNLFARISSEKGVWIIITTHSPFILSKIPSEHIRLLSKVGNAVQIETPSISSDYLHALGLKLNKKGVLFVEDRASREFIKVWLSYFSNHILQEYDIVDLGGESLIKPWLDFPQLPKNSFKIIGVFDGDCREYNEKHNWPYCFLPTDKAPEKIFKDNINRYIDQLTDMLGRKRETIVRVLGAIQGENHHDWFEDFHKGIGVTYEQLMSALFQLWITSDENNYKEAEDSFKELLSKI